MQEDVFIVRLVMSKKKRVFRVTLDSTCPACNRRSLVVIMSDLCHVTCLSCGADGDGFRRFQDAVSCFFNSFYEGE